jgi:hypothetical protein
VDSVTESGLSGTNDKKRKRVTFDEQRHIQNLLLYKINSKTVKDMPRLGKQKH